MSREALKNNIFRFLYAIEAALIGALASKYFPAETSFLKYILIVGVTFILIFSIKETYLDRTWMLVLGLIVGLVFAEPIAHIIVWLLAWFIVIVKGIWFVIKWIFGIFF